VIGEAMREKLYCIAGWVIFVTFTS